MEETVIELAQALKKIVEELFEKLKRLLTKIVEELFEKLKRLLTKITEEIDIDKIIKYRKYKKRVLNRKKLFAKRKAKYGR